MLRVVAAFAIAGVAILTLAADPSPSPKLEPDGAPSRVGDGPGMPPPIVWPAPKLGRGPFNLETVEERHIGEVGNTP